MNFERYRIHVQHVFSTNDELSNNTKVNDLVTLTLIFMLDVTLAPGQIFHVYILHTCQVGKVQKREISLFASCQRGRFARNHHSASLILSINIQIPAEILKMMRYSPPYNGLKLIILCIAFFIVLCGYFAELAMHLLCKIQYNSLFLRRKW